MQDFIFRPGQWQDNEKVLFRILSNLLLLNIHMLFATTYPDISPVGFAYTRKTFTDSESLRIWAHIPMVNRRDQAISGSALTNIGSRGLSPITWRTVLVVVITIKKRCRDVLSMSSDSSW